MSKSPIVIPVYGGDEGLPSFGTFVTAEEMKVMKRVMGKLIRSNRQLYH